MAVKSRHQHLFRRDTGTVAAPTPAISRPLPHGGPFPPHAPACRQLLTPTRIVGQASPSASHSRRAPSTQGSRPCTSPQTQLISSGNGLQQFFDNTPQICSHPSPSSSSAHAHHASTLPPAATFSLQDPPPPAPQHFDSPASQRAPTPLVRPFQDPDLKTPAHGKASSPAALSQRPSPRPPVCRHPGTPVSSKQKSSTTSASDLHLHQLLFPTSRAREFSPPPEDHPVSRSSPEATKQDEARAAAAPLGLLGSIQHRRSPCPVR